MTGFIYPAPPKPDQPYVFIHHPSVAARAGQLRALCVGELETKHGVHLDYVPDALADAYCPPGSVYLIQLPPFDLQLQPRFEVA